MHTRDRIVAGLLAAAATAPTLLAAFDVMSADQAVAIVAALSAFAVGYRTDRAAAKKALRK